MSTMEQVRKVLDDHFPFSAQMNSPANVKIAAEIDALYARGGGGDDYAVKSLAAAIKQWRTATFNYEVEDARFAAAILRARWTSPERAKR